MTESSQHLVHGQTYYAFNEGQFGTMTTWMIRKFVPPPIIDPLTPPPVAETTEPVEGESVDDESNYVEALISIASNDPVVAINAAIQREGWA